KAAANTSSPMTSERKRSGWVTVSRSPSSRGAGEMRFSRSRAEETVMGLMLAKRGDEGERQEERNRRAKNGSQQVPLAGRPRISQAPAADASNPSQDRAQPGHVEHRAG